MPACATGSRNGQIAPWIARVLVAVPVLIAAWLAGPSPPEKLAAPGLVLPGLSRLPMGIVTLSAAMLLLVRIAALGLGFGSNGKAMLPLARPLSMALPIASGAPDWTCTGVAPAT